MQGDIESMRFRLWTGTFFYPLVSSSFHNPMKSLHSGKLIKWVHSTQRERGNYRFLVAPSPPPPLFFSLSLSWTCRFIWIKDKTHFYVGCCSQSGENIGSVSHSREMKIWGGVDWIARLGLHQRKQTKKKCTQRRREKKKKVEWPLDPYFDSRKYAGWSGGLVPFG